MYFFALFGTHQQRKLKLLTELYQYTVDFLNEMEEEYWADYGTLLGYYREGGIIPHDIDVDFGMHEKSYQKVIENKLLLSPKVKFYDSSHRHHGPKLYINYKGFDVDIYFYEDLGETIRNYENTCWPNERRKMPKNLVYPLQWAEFLDKKCMVPAKPKDYLEYIYGYLGTDSKRNLETGFWEKI
ncbi:MAG: LicD family protein [Cyclobacteriaceae bacterium]